MTPTKKIFINVVATYGRSLYALALGLITARWALQALGKVDYGLSGLVGGLAAMVTFLNGLLSYAVSRFYAVSVGAGLKDGNAENAIDECRRWFNAALLIHSVVPTILLLVGYPLGIWMVEHFLSIPPDRVYACVWVWRYTCLSCFIGMISVPFNAMYGAKQDIAELTIYSIVTTTLNAFFLYYMITHPGDWLSRFAGWTCFIAVTPLLIQMVRAFYKYPECRYVRKYLWDPERLGQIAKFGTARFWTMFSALICGQGDSILVNKFLGPVYNGSVNIGNSVASHASTLSLSISGAFWPAIANLAGAGEKDKVDAMVFRLCRIGSLLILVFAIPLVIEIDPILILWLKDPPPSVAPLCVVAIADSVLERMSEGLYMPIMAFGKGVGRYSWVIGWAGFTRLAVALTLFLSGVGIVAVCASIIIGRIVVVIVRLRLSRELAGLSVWKWINTVLYPISLLAAATYGVGCLCRFLSPSIVRIVLTTVVCEMIFLPLAYFIILNAAERGWIQEKVCLFTKRLGFKR